jgi:hypothetical protein
MDRQQHRRGRRIRPTTPRLTDDAETDRRLAQDDVTTRPRSTVTRPVRLVRTRRRKRRPLRSGSGLPHGEYLRRARRRVDARAHLRSALEVFEETPRPPSPDAFALLVTAGVQIQHGDPTPQPPPVHPFTIDNLIDFHRLLDTQNWFTELQQLR